MQNGYKSIRSLTLGWVFILGFILLLNGCTTLQTKDGPPSYPVDVSNIPDAKPKVEK